MSFRRANESPKSEGRTIAVACPHPGSAEHPRFAPSPPCSLRLGGGENKESPRVCPQPAHVHNRRQRSKGGTSIGLPKRKIWVQCLCLLRVSRGGAASLTTWTLRRNGLRCRRPHEPPLGSRSRAVCRATGSSLHSFQALIVISSVWFVCASARGRARRSATANSGGPLLVMIAGCSSTNLELLSHPSEMWAKYGGHRTVQSSPTPAQSSPEASAVGCAR